MGMWKRIEGGFRGSPMVPGTGGVATGCKVMLDQLPLSIAISFSSRTASVYT
jgi:hypothetical protein